MEFVTIGKRRGMHRILARREALWHSLRRGVAFVLLACLVVPAPAWADAVEDALRERVEALRAGADLHPAGGDIAARRLIPDFYAQRDFSPAWTSAERRRALLELVDASRSHGLDPADYQADLLRRLAGDAGDAATAADRDLLYTEALVRLAYHLHFGKVNPRELYDSWNFSRSIGSAEPAKALEALVDADSLEAAVDAFAPQLDAYRGVRSALAKYRAVQAAGGWPPFPPGPTLHPGDRGPRVTALAARLAASGDHHPTAAPEAGLFDAGLREAVVRFQRRHGLEPDGVVGPRTQAELARSIGSRIDQIRVNLERLRWVAPDLGSDYLMVDIAGFEARLYLDGQLAWASRVVVGKPYRKTPSFRARMQYLVLNPDWVVPPTILRQDVLPKLADNPDYLAAHDMRVVDGAGRDVPAGSIDWRRYRNGGFPYQIVQAPGPANPLGRIKFMLPNDHAVYLHDTPSKALFARAQRTYSSGCIRLERPLDLAVLLLDDPERWNAETLQAAIDEGDRSTLPVRRHVAVMILYQTVAVDEDGTVRFHPDVYHRDAEVLAALASPFRFSPVSRGAREAAAPSAAR